MSGRGERCCGGDRISPFDQLVANQAQDDQGRIVAALGDTSVVRLARDGGVLAGPFSPGGSAQELGALDVTPSPAPSAPRPLP